MMELLDAIGSSGFSMLLKGSTTGFTATLAFTDGGKIDGLDCTAQ